MTKDGKEEDFIYRGNIGEFLKGLAGHDISDILIEEPELEDVFMHFYEEEKGV